MQTALVYDGRPLGEVVQENFAAFLDNADYLTVLEYMGIGRMQFLLRKQMTRELAGLYMALWRLVLNRSFANEADRLFADFRAAYAASHPGKHGTIVTERALQYWEMLAPTGDSDFRDVARHLVSFLINKKQDSTALTLKLALHLRNIYQTLFEHLI